MTRTFYLNHVGYKDTAISGVAFIGFKFYLNHVGYKDLKLVFLVILFQCFI